MIEKRAVCAKDFVERGRDGFHVSPQMRTQACVRPEHGCERACTSSCLCSGLLGVAPWPWPSVISDEVKVLPDKCENLGAAVVSVIQDWQDLLDGCSDMHVQVRKEALQTVFTQTDNIVNRDGHPGWIKQLFRFLRVSFSVQRDVSTPMHSPEESATRACRASIAA